MVEAEALVVAEEVPAYLAITVNILRLFSKLLRQEVVELIQD